MRSKTTRNSVIVLVFLVLILGCCWLKRYAIYDWFRLYNYQPPATIVQLADQTTMTPYARHLFYVYHPDIEDSASFNRHCSVTAQVIVLGCTVHLQGIYLYNITDPQLGGIEQVTAAYEMLHVGYERLSPSKRTQIDALVMQAYQAAITTDPSLKTQEQSYLQTEGQGAVANELHSMMGTEVANLPPELEVYYQQYFTNRQTIINYKNQYEAAFNQRQQTVTNDDAELGSLKQRITTDEANLNSADQQLTNQKTQLNSLLSSGQIDSYNAGVAGYNDAVDAYNSELSQTSSLITQYNQLVASRNTINLQINELYQTISSLPLSSESSIPSSH